MWSLAKSWNICDEIHTGKSVSNCFELATKFVVTINSCQAKSKKQQHVEFVHPTVGGCEKKEQHIFCTITFIWLIIIMCRAAYRLMCYKELHMNHTVSAGTVCARMIHSMDQTECTSCEYVRWHPKRLLTLNWREKSDTRNLKDGHRRSNIYKYNEN